MVTRKMVPFLQKGIVVTNVITTTTTTITTIPIVKMGMEFELVTLTLKVSQRKKKLSLKKTGIRSTEMASMLASAEWRTMTTNELELVLTVKRWAICGDNVHSPYEMVCNELRTERDSTIDV